MSAFPQHRVPLFCSPPWNPFQRALRSAATTLDLILIEVEGKDPWSEVNESRSWNSPGQNTGVGSLFLLQGIFPTQGSNPGLPHCRQILYQLSHRGSPRILEWVAYSFSSGSSQPRNWTRVSCIAGVFFTNWVLREALWQVPICSWHTRTRPKWPCPFSKKILSCFSETTEQNCKLFRWSMHRGENVDFK